MIVPAGSPLSEVRAACHDVAWLGGGEVILEAGGTDWPDETLDLSAYGGGITLRGQGIRATTIRSAASDKPTILLARQSSSFNAVRDLGIRQNGGCIPAERRAGNHAIMNVGGTGYGAWIERVEAMFFGDAGIHIEGETGPTKLIDLSVQFCAGYAVEILPNGNGAGTQNVILIDGNQQMCWGGTHIKQSYTGRMEGVDIELGAYARYPALNLEGFVGSWKFDGPTFSMAPEKLSSDLRGCVVMTGDCLGNVFLGCDNRCLAQVPNYYLPDFGAANTSIIGGHCEGAGTERSSYPVVIGRGRFTVIQTLGVTDTYQPGKQAVCNECGADNYTQVVGWLPMVNGPHKES